MQPFLVAIELPFIKKSKKWSHDRKQLKRYFIKNFVMDLNLEYSIYLMNMCCVPGTLYQTLF